MSITFSHNEMPIYSDENRSLEERVDDALSKMSVEEKVALCHAQSKFSSPGVKRLGIPELWMSDGPHGIREEILWDDWGKAGWTNDSCTAFPALTCLAATFDPELAYAYGKALGEEARYRKKDVLLGPGVNIYRTPLNGRNFEYMGEDPFLASTLVVPYIQGVQQNGVAACVKHYALNNQEYWRMDVDVDLSDRALHEIYLPAFKAAVLQGKVWSIMGAYNKFRGEHCCHNELLLNQILKKDWNFDGVVISDWGGAHNTKDAIYNGLDIEMATDTDGLSTSGQLLYDSYHLADPFLQAVKSGEVKEDILNDKAGRILRLILRTSMNRSRPWGSFSSPQHFDVARKVAESGIVLLKNENNFLPICVERKAKILVVGENAVKSMTEGGGSSELKTSYEVSPLEGIRKTYGEENVDYVLGYTSNPDGDNSSLRKEAIEHAKKADYVFLVGGLNKNLHQDCEAADRTDFGLPYEQSELILDLLTVNKNLLLVLLSGNAVEMPWIEKVPALIQAWYGGSESGNALANILSGKVNPSGKLPFTFPYRLSDSPAHQEGESTYPGIDKQVFYQEDILVGYRWYDTQKIKPLFPFGFGLSYTEFQLSEPQVNKTEINSGDVLEVKVKITNKGEFSGSEVIQCYISKPLSSVLRPEKELKGFAKTFLNPEETKEISLELSVKDWEFYDDKTQKWELESGEYLILIGTSSDKIVVRIPVFVV